MRLDIRNAACLLLALSFAPRAVPESVTAATLAEASRQGDVQAVVNLLATGLNPDIMDRYGKTPLFYASLFNHYQVVQALLDHHADPNLKAKSHDSAQFAVTPLENAAYLGNLPIATLLISSGADAADGRALRFAVQGRHLDIVSLLLEKGAAVNTRDQEGGSVLDDAVWRGSLDAASLLIAHGAHLNEGDTETGATPVNEAAYLGQTSLVAYLLRLQPDLSIPDKHGFLPVENAVRMGKEDCALLLLAANPPANAELSLRLIASAISKDEARVITVLLGTSGSNVNSTLPSGATLLDAASVANAARATRVLLAGGADPNRFGSNGNSPLEDASLRGFQDIVKVLLNHGALVNRPDRSSGVTPLQSAAAFGKLDVVQTLLDHAAQPNQCGLTHKTAYLSAIENGFQNVAALIQSRGGTKTCE